MYFEEQSVDAYRSGSPRHVRHILALPAGRSTLAARNLHAVRSVHNYRVTQLAHNRKAAHIGYQRIVAEACASFRQHNVFVAGFFNFFDYVFHIPRSKELAFFYINRPAGFARLVNKVGLAAQKGRNLQNICHFGSRLNLIGFVDIGNDRHAQILLNLR